MAKCKALTGSAVKGLTGLTVDDKLQLDLTLRWS